MSKKPTSLAALAIERRQHGKAEHSPARDATTDSASLRGLEEAGANLAKPLPRPGLSAFPEQLSASLAEDGDERPAGPTTPTNAASVEQSRQAPQPVASTTSRAPQASPPVPADVPSQGEPPRRRLPKERPAEVLRTQMGARIPATLAKRLARYCLEEEESQQDAVTAALEEFLTSYGY